MHGVAAAALVVAMSAGLVGCSSNDASFDDSTDRATSRGSTGGFFPHGRPTKEEYRDAWVEQNGRGERNEKGEWTSVCVADESYDKLSDATLRAIVEGNDRQKLPDEETQALMETALECAGLSRSATQGPQ